MRLASSSSESTSTASLVATATDCSLRARYFLNGKRCDSNSSSFAEAAEISVGGKYVKDERARSGLYGDRTR